MAECIARVTLKKCKSYRVGDQRFIKDVPQTIKGADVETYQNNAHFKVRVIQAGTKKVTKKKKPVKEPEAEVKTKPKPSGKKTKASLKRRS